MLPKPTTYQRIVASGVTIRLCALLIMLAAITSTCLALWVPGVTPLDAGATALVEVSYIVAGVVAWLAALPAISFMLRPVFRAQELRNGGPFELDDVVMIIAGRHRNTVSRVYALAQHPRVRVELGESARSDNSDVFAGHQIMKVRCKPEDFRAGLSMEDPGNRSTDSDA